jgi:hypothetical protein
MFGLYNRKRMEDVAFKTILARREKMEIWCPIPIHSIHCITLNSQTWCNIGLK